MRNHPHKPKQKLTQAITETKKTMAHFVYVGAWPTLYFESLVSQAPPTLYWTPLAFLQSICNYVTRSRSKPYMDLNRNPVCVHGINTKLPMKPIWVATGIPHLLMACIQGSWKSIEKLMGKPFWWLPWEHAITETLNTKFELGFMYRII